MSFGLEFCGWTNGSEMELQQSAPGFFHPSAVLIPNGGEEEFIPFGFLFVILFSVSLSAI